MKAHKSIIIFSVATVVLLIIILSVAAALHSFCGYSRILKANWNFALPEKSHYTNSYSKQSKADFHGDGIRYHVFLYDQEAPIDQMFSWESAEQKTIFHDSFSEAADDWLDSIDVPTNERPDYEKCTYWYQKHDDNSEIIVFWDKAQKKIYIAESFL